MKEYDLKLSEQYLYIIDQALQELPYKIANPIIMEISRQLQEQIIKNTDQ